LKNEFINAELSTAHNTMELLRRPMRLRIGGVGGIARSNRREGQAQMVKRQAMSSGDIVERR
jgi:hypothetical protein